MTALPATDGDAATAAIDGVAAEVPFAGPAAGVWASRGRVRTARQANKTIRRTKPPGRSNRDANPLDPAKAKMVPGEGKI
jgi:hypothetical protein